MKHSIMLVAATLSWATAFAQAPAGALPRPPAQINPSASGGAPAAKAEMNTEAKTGAMPMASGMGSTSAMGAGMGMGMKGMDANGDGMVSKKEWQAHHDMMWGKMKSKNGIVPMAEIEAMMKSGGPN